MLPWWLSGKESACKCRRHGFNCWSRKIPHGMEQLKLGSHSFWPELESPRAATAEARRPRAWAPGQKKPPEWEAREPQQRGGPTQSRQEAPLRAERPRSEQRGGPTQRGDPTQSREEAPLRAERRPRSERRKKALTAVETQHSHK